VGDKDREHSSAPTPDTTVRGFGRLSADVRKTLAPTWWRRGHAVGENRRRPESSISCITKGGGGMNTREPPARGLYQFPPSRERSGKHPPTTNWESGVFSVVRKAWATTALGPPQIRLLHRRPFELEWSDEPKKPEWSDRRLPSNVANPSRFHQHFQRPTPPRRRPRADFVIPLTACVK